MNGKKWLILLCSIVIFAFLGFWIFRTTGASASVNERELITVERADFPILVSGTGTLEAAKSVSIGPPYIRNMHRFRLSRMVEEGTIVSEGDFLLEFDGADINQRLRDVTANFQKVQEEYRKKRSDFDIQLKEQKLSLEQAISDYEKLENKLNQQAELESAIVIAETRIRRDMAKKRVDLLEQKIGYLDESGKLDLQISRSNESHYRGIMDDYLDAIDSLTVRAPVSGVVIYQRGWNNEPREIGSNVFVMDTVLQIPDLNTLRAKVWVDEVDAGKVKIDNDVIIQVEALQGRTYSGKVTSLSSILKQASYDRPQKIAETMVAIEDADLNLLRPGMSARVQILVGQHPQAIVIPLASVQERLGRSFVQVWNSEEGEWRWREVELLTNDGIAAVVSAGLDEGERIRSNPKNEV
jgi:multidrug efflux pump subunit AcrA (membrane-fusion protein)